MAKSYNLLLLLVTILVLKRVGILKGSAAGLIRDESWVYLLFLLQRNRMCCVSGVSVSIGLVVLMVCPLLIVVLGVNVRVISIAGGCLLNNVHNSCWAYCTSRRKWRKLSTVSLTQNFLHITNSFVFSVSVGVVVSSLEQYVKVSAAWTFITVKRVWGLI